MAVFLVVLVVAAGIGFWWWRGKQGAAKPGAHAAQAAESVVAAVPAPARRPGRMINPGENPCHAAQKIQTAWYAEGETPRLPLGECEHPEGCRCTWMHVLDRRMTHRRVGQDRRGELRFEDKSDRRTGEDRRDRRSNVWKNSG